MKKISYLLLIILAILFIPNVHAANVEIESVTFDSKSDNTTINNEATFKDLSINFDVKFVKKDDFIKYKVIINNKSNEDYEIKDNKSENEYVEYIYDYDDNNRIVEKNKKTTLFITIKYTKEVPDELLVNGSFVKTDSLIISLGNEKNPNTGVNIIIPILLMLSIMIITFITYKKNNIALYLFLILIMVPIGVYAIEVLQIKVESKIEISKEEIPVIDGVYYVIYDTRLKVGETVTSKEGLYDNIDDVYAEINRIRRKVFLKHVFVNNKLTRSYIGFVKYDGNTYYYEGGTGTNKKEQYDLELPNVFTKMNDHTTCTVFTDGMSRDKIDFYNCDDRIKSDDTTVGYYVGCTIEDNGISYCSSEITVF